MEGRSLALPSSHSYAASLSSSAGPSPSSGSSAASIPIDGRHPRRPATPAPPLSPLTGSSLVQICFPRRPDLIPTPASRLTLLSPSQSSSSHFRVKSWRTTTDLRRGRPKKEI